MTGAHASRRAEPPGSRRLFFAVFPPVSLRGPLGSAREKLVGKYWKPVPPEQMHVTLLFLGGTRAEAFARVRQAGLEAAAEVPAFEGRLRGTGFFPNEGNPRVWFVKAEGDGFAPLSSGLRARLEAGDEPFKPHLTLARKKGAAPRPAPLVFDLAWPVTEIALVRSLLRPAGPTYETVERFPLAPPRPASPEALASPVEDA